ncbi:MAG: phage tail protein [Lactobacillus sp.]|nr:phage tail protein [Lactobacillus sp.]
MADAHPIGTTGFRRVILGILDDDENVTKTIMIDENTGGTIELKVSGFAGQSNVQYASNIAYWISNAGIGTGKVELSIAEMPKDIATEVLGDLYEDGIYYTKSDVKQPYVAMIAESQDLNSNPMWVAIAKVKFTTQDAVDLKTAEDKGMTLNTISLSGSAVTRKVDHLVKAKATNSDGITLTQFASKVFPGWTGKFDDSKQNINDDHHRGNGSSNTGNGTVTPATPNVPNGNASSSSSPANP